MGQFYYLDETYFTMAVILLKLVDVLPWTGRIKYYNPLKEGFSKNIPIRVKKNIGCYE